MQWSVVSMVQVRPRTSSSYVDVRVGRVERTAESLERLILRQRRFTQNLNLCQLLPGTFDLYI